MNHFIVDGRYKDVLQLHGINIGEVLKKARLPEDTFCHNIVKIKEQDYYGFMDAIEFVSGDTKLPIKLSTTSQIENFSPPIFASYCSKNGRICIEDLQDIKN